MPTSAGPRLRRKCLWINNLQLRPKEGACLMNRRELVVGRSGLCPSLAGALPMAILATRSAVPSSGLSGSSRAGSGADSALDYSFTFGDRLEGRKGRVRC